MAISEFVMIVAAPWFVLFFVGNSKIKHMNFILFVIPILVYLQAVVKALYNDPRPYMVDENIEPFNENIECGHPSGHAWMGYVFFATIFELFVFKRKLYIKQHYEDDEDSKNLPYNHTITVQVSNLRYFIGMFCLVVSYASLCYSRMYLGVHSLDQVIAGFMYGFISHFIYNTVGEDLLYKFFFFIMEQKKHKQSLKMPFFIVLTFHILTLGFSLLLYLYFTT